MTSGFLPLDFPIARKVRVKRRDDSRLARCVLAAVLLLEAAILLLPKAMLLHPVQGTVLFKQASGYAMVTLLVLAMAFGRVRRRPAAARHHKLLNELHQFGGLVLLMLLALHVGQSPSGFLQYTFHGLAVAAGAGALRSVAGPAIGRPASTLLLVLHISLSCLVCAAAALHLYFVYAYTG